MLKKATFFVLTGAICLSCLTVAGAVRQPAAGITPEIQTALSRLDFSKLPADSQDAVLAASPYAYMDLSTVRSAAQKAQILDARNTIVSAQTWKADENTDAMILNVRTGETTAVAAFYDLFPADWEMPAADAME